MSQVDRIVEVQISRQTQQIDITAFDIPLILVRVDEAEIDMPNRVETFSTIEAVGNMFGVSHNAYKMAAKLFSGDMRPSTFKIGKVAYSSAQGVGVATGFVETTLEGQVTYTVSTPPTSGDAVVDSAGVWVYTGDPGYAGSDSFTITVTDEDDNEESFNIDVDVVPVDISESYAEALQEVMEADDSWYVLLSDARFDQDIIAMASVIQSQRRIYVTSTSSNNTPNSTSETDIGALLSNSNYSRTAIIYSPTSDQDYPEAAWVGEQIVEVPGSNTWAFKSLNGVAVAKLNDTQINTLEEKNVNYYITIKGAPVIQTGVMASGDWIDEIIFVDWLYARIQEGVFYRIINSKKIPYTCSGFALIEAEIRSVLAQGVANGGIADDTPYTVNSPDPLLIPEQQRASRIAGDFQFQCRLAGAVHRVIVRGIVTV